MEENRALAIAAHPDDIEFFMSGTLMQLRDAGYQIHYMNLANGCCGSTSHDASSIAEIRRREAQAAAESIGAEFHESICNDLEIFYDKPTLAKVASVIRLVAPRIVLTHSPSDYMEDHTNTCRLAVTATFARGMPNFPVAPSRPAVTSNVTVYHAQPYANRDPLRQPVTPELYVDVTDFLERKVEMLAQHRSQKEWLDASQGLDSYLQTLRDLDAEVGRMSGRFSHAEGWRRHLHLGFGGPQDDPLREALSDSVHALERRDQIQYYENKLAYEIDSWDLHVALKARDKVTVVDARSPAAFATEHIPGAINVPHRQMSAETTQQIDRSTLVVTYCDGIGCNGSTKAALNMVRLGFRVKELLGGLDWWKRDGHGTICGSGTNSDCGCA